MKKYLIPVIFSFSLLLVACSEPEGNCVSGSGTVIFQDRHVDNFDSIDVAGYVNLILTQDSVNKVTVEAGEKIINGITAKVENNKLYINNVNSCNWLRDYGKPLNVHVNVRDLHQLDYEASGNVTSTNTLYSNSLTVDVHDGCGTINLKVNCEYGNFIERMGTVDIQVEGRIIYASFYSAGYGPFRLEKAEANFVFGQSLSSNDCYVRATQGLGVEISSLGNIYYTGNPDTISSVITGTGKLIPF